MDRSVPTLLGITIILMVAVLVVLIYDFRVTYYLATGHAMVGTVGGRMLSPGETPSDQAGGREQRAAPARISPTDRQRAHGRLHQVQQTRRRGQQRRLEQRPHKPGGEARESARNPGS
jgi:hypothetical protein